MWTLGVPLEGSRCVGELWGSHESCQGPFRPSGRNRVSDSVRPHRRQPTRLLCPWDSPGKNTGVGCNFFPSGLPSKRGPGLGSFSRADRGIGGARPSGVPRGPATSTGSLASQRHPGKLPKVPGRRRGSGLHSRLPRGVRPRLEGKPSHQVAKVLELQLQHQSFQ